VAETVFLTGGTGQLGASLARRLVQDGHRVRLLVRSRRHPYLADLPVEWVAGDLADERALAMGMQGCRQVYHVAGAVSHRPRDAQRLHDVNVLGTRAVLAAAARAGVGRVVHTSSTAVIGLSGSPDQVLDETAPFDPRFESNPYVRTKHLAEREVERAVAEGLDVVVVSPATIYGGGDINRTTAGVFPGLQRGRMLAAPPGGTAVVSVDDVVGGHLLAMERGRSGRRYILSNENLRYFELLNTIARVVGGPPVRWTLPAAAEWPLAAIAAVSSTLFPGLPATASVIRFSFGYRYFSAARARAELDWVPRVSFDDAVRAAWQFFVESVGAA
jgi:dihydroflavonol-4-reductase